MKVAILLCASLVLYYAAVSVADSSSEAQQPDCGQFTDAKECPTTFVPLCGSDGNTYPSLCFLCLVNKLQNKNVGIASNGTCVTS